MNFNLRARTVITLLVVLVGSGILWWASHDEGEADRDRAHGQEIGFVGPVPVAVSSVPGGGVVLGELDRGDSFVAECLVEPHADAVAAIGISTASYSGYVPLSLGYLPRGGPRLYDLTPKQLISRLEPC